MIADRENALLCDLAETYHIYDMRQYSPEYIATLALGLREDSRVKMAIGGLQVDVKTLLLAHLVDNTAINVYYKTKDAQKGVNKPRSMVQALTTVKKPEVKKYNSGSDFDKEWRRLHGH